jgi:hypothetical protein
MEPAMSAKAETLEEKLRRDLEAWRLAKAAIEKARGDSQPRSGR